MPNSLLIDQKGRTRNPLPLFLAAEVFLALAIPFMLIAGYHAFMGTSAGTFEAAKSPSEPGWRSFVEWTPVGLVAKTNAGDNLVSLDLVALGDAEVNSVGLPLGVSYGGVDLRTLTGDQILEHVSSVLRLKLSGIEVAMDNDVTTALEGLFDSVDDVGELPIKRFELATEVNAEGTANLAGIESVAMEMIKFPVGAHPGDRLAVSVVSRSEGVNAEASARIVADLGYEVTDIGNVSEFDSGRTTLVVPASITTDQLNEAKLDKSIERLARELGVDIFYDEAASDSLSVTLLVGSDFKSE